MKKLDLLEKVILLFKKGRYIDEEKVCTNCPELKFYAGTREDGVLITPNEFTCNSSLDPFDCSCIRSRDIEKIAEEVVDIIDLVTDLASNESAFKKYLSIDSYYEVKNFSNIPADGLTDDIVTLFCDIIELSNISYEDIVPVSKREVRTVMDNLIQSENGNYTFLENYYFVENINQKEFLYTWLEKYSDFYEKVSQVVEDLRDLEIW